MITMPRIFSNNIFDDFFDDFSAPAFMPDVRAHGLMKTDVKENKDGFEVSVDLPGYDKENISAELKDGYMTIKAEQTKSNDEKDKNGKIIRRERYQGSCQRSFYVGEDITEEDIKAKYNNGVLTVCIPKKEALPKVEQKKYIAIEG